MARTGEEKILTLVGARRSDLISVTQALVRENSSNPPGDVSQAAAAAVKLLAELIPECDIAIKESAPGIVNIVACIRGHAAGKRLVFSGHLDTYPFGDLSSWMVPPLGGTVSADGKRLFGRGSADMKGGIAASIVAMSVLALKRQLWRGEVVLVLVGDEELMGKLGSQYLLDSCESVKGDTVVCGDAGSPLVVRNGEKGLLWLELTTVGQSAHGAHVHRGVNAIERLLHAMMMLKEVE